MLSDEDIASLESTINQLLIEYGNSRKFILKEQKRFFVDRLMPSDLKNSSRLLPDSLLKYKD